MGMGNDIIALGSRGGCRVLLKIGFANFKNIVIINFV